MLLQPCTQKPSATATDRLNPCSSIGRGVARRRARGWPFDLLQALHWGSEQEIMECKRAGRASVGPDEPPSCSRCISDRPSPRDAAATTTTSSPSCSRCRSCMQYRPIRTAPLHGSATLRGAAAAAAAAAAVPPEESRSDERQQRAGVEIGSVQGPVPAKFCRARRASWLSFRWLGSDPCSSLTCPVAVAAGLLVSGHPGSRSCKRRASRSGLFDHRQA